jgi:hypothetical protein
MPTGRPLNPLLSELYGQSVLANDFVLSRDGVPGSGEFKKLTKVKWRGETKVAKLILAGEVGSKWRSLRDFQV